MNRIIILLTLFCLSTLPALAADGPDPSNLEKARSVFDQVDQTLGNKPAQRKDETPVNKNTKKKKTAKTRDDSEDNVNEMFQDIQDYVTDPSQSTTPADVFIPTLTPEIHGWDLQESTEQNDDQDNDKKVRARKLGALRVKEGIAITRAGKLKLTKNRAIEEAIAPEDFSCAEFDCTHLYFIISPEGKLLGVVPKDAITFTGNSFDSSRLITRKADLSKVRKVKQAQKGAARQVKIRLKQKAVAKLRKSRDMESQPIVDLTVSCFGDSCPTEEEMTNLTELLDGTGAIFSEPEQLSDFSGDDKRLKKSGVFFLKVPLRSAARGAKTKGKRELTFTVECQDSCPDIDDMAESMAEETGGTVEYSDGSSTSYADNEDTDDSSDDEDEKKINRKLKKSSTVAKKKAAVNTRDLSPSLLNGRSYALIIGINDYKHVGKLENCVRDALAVDDVLRSQYGYTTKVILEEKATRDNIMRALNELRKELTANDSLIIYYSGHGHYEKATDTSYWIPVDAEADDTTKMLEARSVVDQLKLNTAKHVLVVADSCFSGTITRTATIGLSKGTTRENYLNKLYEKTSRVLIASGGDEPVTDGGAEGHSIFAEAFINGLRDPFSTVFTAEELMTRHLKESVAGRTEQTPEYKVIRNSGHDGGDYVFVKKH